jgi:hypothetical protein
MDPAEARKRVLDGHAASRDDLTDELHALLESHAPQDDVFGVGLEAS